MKAYMGAWMMTKGCFSKLKEIMNVISGKTSKTYLVCKNCGYRYQAKSWNEKNYMKNPIRMIKKNRCPKCSHLPRIDEDDPFVISWLLEKGLKRGKDGSFFIED